MTSTIRILYVDDESGLLEIGKLFLEQSDEFAVTTAISAPEALRLLQQEQFDAIVSDYQMPGMDGIQFLVEVRKRFGPTPFILFTGRGREEVVIQALNSGANFYLQKGGEPGAQFAELSHKIITAFEHHRSSEKIQSLNRLYSVLSATNKAIISIHTKSDFFSEICRILVGIGGFRMAWIGLADTEQKVIRPVASSGYTHGYLDSINISTEDVPHGRGPTGTAYREGKYYFSNDIVSDPRMEPWRENAMKRGYLANAAFPFALGTKNAGVISLYAPVTGFFDEQIIELLEELADDISFALRTIDEQDERKQAEGALKESETRLRALVENASDIIRILDKEGRIVFDTAASGRLLGYPPGFTLGKSPMEFIHPDDLGRVKQELFNVYDSTNSGIPTEFRVRKADGSYTWVESYGKKLIGVPGIDGVVITTRFIDERKKSEEELLKKNEELTASYEEITATQEELRGNLDELARQEQALRESEANLRAILDATPFPVALVDLQDNNIHYWSRSAHTLFGHTAPTAAEWYELAYPDPVYRQDVINRWKPYLDEAKRSGQPVNTGEYRVTCRDGTVRICELYATFLADKLIVTFNDVTERKVAVAALTENEKRLRTTLEILPVGVFIFSKNGQILMANSMVNRIWGVTKGVVPHSSDMQEFVEYKGWWPDTGVALRPEDWAASRVLMKGEAAPVDIVNIQRFDGSSGTIIVSAVPFRDAGGNVTGAIAVIQDITESRRAEEALLKNAKELQTAYEELTASEEELRQNIDDISRNERVLQESDDLFRGIFDTITSGVAIYEVKNDGASGKDYMIKDFNKTALEIEGKTKEEVVGKSLFDLRPTIDEYGLIPVFQQVWKTGVPAYFPQKVYIDEKYSSWYENRVFRLQSGEIVAVYDDVTERKKSEESLKESEEKYRTLVEKANEAIMIAQDDVFVFANTRMSEILGVPVGKLEGNPFVDFIWPEDRDRVVANYRKRIAGETISDSYEFRIIGAGGRLTWVYLSAAAIQWKGKTATLNLVSDITKRKQAEEALRTSEQKLNSILNNITDVVWSLSWPDLKVHYISPSAEKVYGRSVQEFIDNPSLWAVIVHPEDRYLSQKALEDLQICGSAVRECRIVRPDGSIAWIHDRSKFIFDEHGTPVRAEGITSDITERKMAEVALKESEERFKSYIENSPEGVFIADERGCYLEVNPGACRITGYEKEELLAMQISDLLPPEFNETGLKHFKELIEYGHAFGELLFRHKDGSLRYWSVDAVRLTPTRFIGFVKDITDRKVAEEALALASKKLTLLSDITRHDINNQLLTLNGFLAILHRKVPDPSLEELFSKMTKASERIASMIQFTKEYEKIGVNAPVWQKDRTLVDTAAKLAPLGQVVVKNDLPSGEEVFADPLIVKIFYNLMDNAVRYGGKITTIRFSVEEAGDEHLLVCEDDGDGVVAEEKEKIFERGFGKNTGLGLALSREILAITGITIRETGEPGKGARFEMVVPKGMWRIADVK